MEEQAETTVENANEEISDYRLKKANTKEEDSKNEYANMIAEAGTRRDNAENLLIKYRDEGEDGYRAEVDNQF